MIKPYSIQGYRDNLPYMNQKFNPPHEYKDRNHVIILLDAKSNVPS